MIAADLAIASATIVLAFRSLGTAFHMPAMQASIPMIVPEERLTSASGVTQFIQSASLILGPALALVMSGILPGSGFIAFAALSAVMGLSAPLFSGPYMALLQSKINPGVLGRVMSVVNSMMLIATPLGLLIAGPGAEIIGVARWFLISGTGIVVIGFVCFLNHSIKMIED